MGKTSTGLQFLSANIKVRKLSILAVNVLFWVKIAKHDLRYVAAPPQVAMCGHKLRCAVANCDVRAKSNLVKCAM